MDAETTVRQTSPKADDGRGRDLIRNSLIWDMTLPGMFNGLNEVQTLYRYRSLGFGFVSLTVGNDSIWNPHAILDRLATIRAAVMAEGKSFQVIGSASDIVRARQDGKLAVSFHLQGTNGLGGNIAWVERFASLGITHMLLAYNSRNAVGDGCAELGDAGLSRYGHSLVREMNRLGMLVDGSHTGYRTTMDAIEISTKPFIFSHANAASVFAHYRNIRDDQIVACAKTGGVIGVNGVGAFLGETGAISPELLFRHIDHMTQLVGPSHIGLGLDFVTHVGKFVAMAADSTDIWPSNGGKPVQFEYFAGPEIVGPLVDLLSARGYADDHIRGILGENFFRVFQQSVG